MKNAAKLVGSIALAFAALVFYGNADELSRWGATLVGVIIYAAYMISRQIEKADAASRATLERIEQTLHVMKDKTPTIDSLYEIDDWASERRRHRSS